MYTCIVGFERQTIQYFPDMPHLTAIIKSTLGLNETRNRLSETLLGDE